MPRKEEIYREWLLYSSVVEGEVRLFVVFKGECEKGEKLERGND